MLYTDTKTTRLRPGSFLEVPQPVKLELKRVEILVDVLNK